MSETDFALPPVTFEFFTASLKMQTEMQLGLLNFTGEETKPDLRLARHSIDLLAMLEQKTKGNLTLEEQRFLENTLTELRFRYVQAHEKKVNAGNQEPSPAEPSAAEAGASEGEEQAAS